MIYRSLLFVPGDSERKIEKALGTNSDAIIIDLEDAVSPENRPMARNLVNGALAKHGPDYPGRLWVRVNPVVTEDCLADLAAIVGQGLTGIMLPKADNADDVATVDNYLSALESKAGLTLGSIKILSVMTETAKAFLSTGSYSTSCCDRLSGVLWGAEDLSAALGAAANTDLDGELSFTYKMARSLCLATAAAAECQPIDTVYTDFKNPDGLRDNCNAARREGFLGKIAIHPNQVDIINRAFTPSDAEILHAKAVIRAFDDNPGKGTIALDGRMLDRPHFVQAQRVLAIASTISG